MENYQEEIEKIKTILQENPKGMTVSDISRKIKINRNSVAKYLDIMLLSGHVELITFGPAKVFFPSRRVPIKSMLNYTSEYILVFDKELKIIMINDPFLKFIKSERDKILGQNLNEVILPVFDNSVDIPLRINEAIEGKTFIKDIDFKNKDEDVFFKIRIIPTAFEDGRHGVTIIARDDTDRKLAEKALRDSEKNFKKLLENMNKK